MLLCERCMFSVIYEIEKKLRCKSDNDPDMVFEREAFLKSHSVEQTFVDYMERYYGRNEK